jgi:hypothetical protein
MGITSAKALELYHTKTNSYKSPQYKKLTAHPINCQNKNIAETLRIKRDAYVNNPQIQEKQIKNSRIYHCNSILKTPS